MSEFTFSRISFSLFFFNSQMQEPWVVVIICMNERTCRFRAHLVNRVAHNFAIPATCSRHSFFVVAEFARGRKGKWETCFSVLEFRLTNTRPPRLRLGWTREIQTNCTRVGINRVYSGNSHEFQLQSPRTAERWHVWDSRKNISDFHFSQQKALSIDSANERNQRVQCKPYPAPAIRLEKREMQKPISIKMFARYRIADDHAAVWHFARPDRNLGTVEQRWHAAPRCFMALCLLTHSRPDHWICKCFSPFFFHFEDRWRIPRVCTISWRPRL